MSTSSRDLIQSPYLYLQAAGYANVSHPAILLRWFLTGNVGKHHLPRGDSTFTADVPRSRLFNKPDDFVTISRIRYVEREHVRLFTVSGDDWAVSESWIYRIGNSEFKIKFLDSDLFEKLSMLSDLNEDLNSDNKRRELLRDYVMGKGLLELHPLQSSLYEVGALSFAVNLVPIHEAGIEKNVGIGIEAFSKSLKTNGESASEKISARRILSNIDPDKRDLRIVAENIAFVRFRLIESQFPFSLEFENYDDFWAAKADDRKQVGRFALSTEDNEVYARLARPCPDNSHSIMETWLKYQDGAPVSIQNYRDRWLKESSAQDLKVGVAKHLELSADMAQVIESHPRKSSANDSSIVLLPLLDALRFASVDYHIARMLGLAHIDDLDISSEAGVRFIYIAEYSTVINPNTDEPPLVWPTEEMDIRHLSFSLPTGPVDERLPIPVKLSIRPGISVQSTRNNPVELTDAGGYTADQHNRFLSLYTSLSHDYKQGDGFFNPTTEFESSEHSVPVLIGIKTRNWQGGDPTPVWNPKELRYDSNWNEPVPFVFSQDKPVCIEQIPNVPEDFDMIRVNDYAPYSIDIFSRANPRWNASSQIKLNEHVEIETKFTRPNTLKPPSGVSVQLIQEEDPIIFTSKTEQLWRQSLPPNAVLCRLTFNYGYSQDLNYQYAESIRIYHRKQLPLNVIGSVKSLVFDDPSQKTFVVETDIYRYSSNGQVAEPYINIADAARFIGGMLSFDSKNYVVERIESGTQFPKIRLRAHETWKPADPVDTLDTVINPTFYPDRDTTDFGQSRRFTLSENLSVSENWAETGDNGSKIIKHHKFLIEIGQKDEITEKYKNKDGIEIIEKSRGFKRDAAQVEVLIDEKGVPVNGRYTIDFEGFELPPHSQLKTFPDESFVEWYKGTVRIHTLQGSNSQRKELLVDGWTTGSAPDALRLTVTDISYDPNKPTNHIETGQVSVYFYPGYRVYLREDSNIGFTSDGLLPAAVGEESRVSMIGLQSVATSDGSTHLSPVSVPASLVSRRIVHPVKPPRPLGPKFANPLDFFNKANYSFVLNISVPAKPKKDDRVEMPYGLVFFRIDSDRILASLYKPETIAEIKKKLPEVSEDPYLDDRWLDLLSFDYSKHAGEFKEFPGTKPGTFYGFPYPDRNELLKVDPNGVGVAVKPGLVVKKIQDALYENLLPLTQQPVLFERIRGRKPEDANYVPVANKQTLDDQAPMAKLFDIKESADKTRIIKCKLLFTDFTLDGNMSSETLYFYLVREMGNKLNFGEPSAFSAPVRIVNTAPPPRPVFRDLKIHFTNDWKPAVDFEVFSYSPSSNISKILIFRTSDESVENAVEMEIVREVPGSEFASTDLTLTVTDDFRTKRAIPFGQLYYRLAFVREIEVSNPDTTIQRFEIMSEPTDKIPISMIDPTKPQKPVLSIGKVEATGEVITQIELIWTKACDGGSYQLFRLNESCVWKAVGTPIYDETEHTYIFNPVLNILDASGQPTLHRFRIEATNTAGRRTQSDIVTVIGPWCA